LPHIEALLSRKIATIFAEALQVKKGFPGVLNFDLKRVNFLAVAVNIMCLIEDYDTVFDLKLQFFTDLSVEHIRIRHDHYV
jgi:hypothetical protein